MPVTGLSESERVALSNLMDAVIAVPGLDDETRRRARWLKLRLDGVDSLAEIDRRYAIGRPVSVIQWCCRDALWNSELCVDLGICDGSGGLGWRESSKPQDQAFRDWLGRPQPWLD